MKTIYLARHAKSSWNMNFTKDFDRPLNKRGESDAIRMGEEMRSRLWQPERIIASPAMRVKQTCKAYCEILGYPLENVDWNDDIYEAYTITLLQILINLNESTKSVMLIGHNPAMEDLLLQLCGKAKVSECQQKDGKILTTANVAKLSFDGVWKDITMASISLDELIRPKTI